MVSLSAGVRNEMLDPFATHPKSRIWDGGVNVLLKFCLCPFFAFFLFIPPSVSKCNNKIEKGRRRNSERKSKEEREKENIC